MTEQDQATASPLGEALPGAAPTRSQRRRRTRSSAVLVLSLIELCGSVTVAAPRDGNDPPATDSEAIPADPVGDSRPAGTTTSRNSDECCEAFREMGRLEARISWNRARGGTASSPAPRPASSAHQDFADYAASRVQEAKETFFRGRYNRSRARLPENIERWRSEPDIANPGPDLANFPNSAFTLPAGRAYVELSPVAYYGPALDQTAQYNAEFLLRYGLTDNIELRLFGNGVSWSGGSHGGWGFAPIAFDTKIQLWTEKPDYFIPAAGFEAYLQTQWLGSAPFNAGTQPAFSFNFDQSLPLEIDFEYNIGATRIQTADGSNVWELSFQWAFERDFFHKDFDVFVHGFYNATNLPRLPSVTVPRSLDDRASQNAVGAGFVWTVNQRLALYGQVSGGATKFTPSLISTLGFAVAF